MKPERKDEIYPKSLKVVKMRTGDPNRQIYQKPEGVSKLLTEPESGVCARNTFVY